MAEQSPAKASERIDCAAVRANGRIYAVPAPARHDDVLRAMAAAGRDLEPGQIQGFMTSAGRFVDRYEARQIAENAQQLVPGHSPYSRELYTSDVW